MRFLSVVAVAVASLAPLVLTAPVAHAQANLTFSGGNGSPLSLTLAAPVSYTVTRTSVPTTAPYFVFDAVGGPILAFSAATGTLTFSINGGSVQTINTINNNIDSGSVTSDDLYAYGPFPGVTIGDLVTLTSGTLTTSANRAGAPPANGSFTTFLTNGEGTRLSSNGVAGSVAVPEPGSVVLLGLAVLPMLGVTASRRRRA